MAVTWATYTAYITSASSWNKKIQFQQTEGEQNAWGQTEEDGLWDEEWAG